MREMKADISTNIQDVCMYTYHIDIIMANCMFIIEIFAINAIITFFVDEACLHPKSKSMDLSFFYFSSNKASNFTRSEQKVVTEVDGTWME